MIIVFNLAYPTGISVNPTGDRKCRLTCNLIFTSVSAKRFGVNVEERSRTELFLIEKCSYFSVKLIKQHIFKSKCNNLLSKEEYARKRIHNCSSVLIENSVTRVTVRIHPASLVMPNSYPRDGIFNQHLTTIKDSYIVTCFMSSIR